ncbi:MAG: glycosyltransferase [Acidobacteria bacterium]|nr:glycosyltransferase [Acidobacteriota bacterium]
MRIVFLTHRLPYAPNRGDRTRAFHELRLLTTRHETHLLSLVHDREERSHGRDLHGTVASVSTALVPRFRNLARGALRLATARPLTHSLLDAPQVLPMLERLVSRVRPDLVIAYCSGMVRFAFEPPLAGVPYLLDMVDVDSEKWAALARTGPRLMRWIYAREARELKRFEAEATCRARWTFVVNDREAASLRALAGQHARITVLPNGVDLSGLAPVSPPATSSDVVFCGVMDYAPNEQGALWMAGEVWPRVTAARREARLLLVGANPTRRLLQLPRRDTSVVVTGSVSDVRPYLWNGAVSAAPLMIARGVQNKVLEAVAAGLPAVVTPVVAEGLPVEVMPACRVAGSPEAFAEALTNLLALAPGDRRRIASTARLGDMQWDRRLQPLLDTVERLAVRSPSSPRRN